MAFRRLATSAADRSDFFPHLMLNIADLTAQGRLSGMQLFFGGKFKTSRFGHGHKVTKVSQFHDLTSASEAYLISRKSNSIPKLQR
jgi:hypothetical protein